MSEQNPSLTKKTSSLMDDILADPFGDMNGGPVLELAKEEKPVKLIDVIPEENRARAYQIAEQIDPRNHQAMIAYGTQAQTKLLTFSHSMLEHVQKKDIGEVGDIINDLMKRLNDMNPDELKQGKQSLFSRMFGKISDSVQEILSKYQKTGAQIDRISVSRNTAAIIRLKVLFPFDTW